MSAPGPTSEHITERMARRVFGVVVRPFQTFLRTEASSGVLLFGAAIAALGWATASSETYERFTELPLEFAMGDLVLHFTVAEAINDGLMTVFFFVVGMEIKREMLFGELDTLAKASLPALAAIGGMILPATIYAALNHGGQGRPGWAIPMATDIAFCVGLLTLLRRRVPGGLVVFVTALAIFDDIGGVVAIALFYGGGMHPEAVGEVVIAMACIAFLNRARVASLIPYGVAGVALWHAFHGLGIHPTIAGVLLGFGVPAVPPRPPRAVLAELVEHAQSVAATAPDEELDAAQITMMEERLEDIQAPLQRFVHALHPFVAFGIMPLFALTNAGLDLHRLSLSELVAPIALGTTLGLLVGKSLGVFGVTWLAVRLRLAPMPGGASHRQLLGAAVTTGIGFTVALFIAGLAFDGRSLDAAKLGILAGSFGAGVLGATILLVGAPRASAQSKSRPSPKHRSLSGSGDSSLP